MIYRPAEKTNTLFRDEIEEIIKNENIDRRRFNEFDKNGYEDIIKKFYYAFSDYNHFTPAVLTLNRKRLPIRSGLYCYSVSGIYAAGSWEEYLKAIKSAIPSNADEKLFLILSEGWVYEGYADEMCKVLSKINEVCSDFFIVSKKFDWFIAHDYIDDCAFMYRK